jgi:hypothetical protein
MPELISARTLAAAFKAQADKKAAKRRYDVSDKRIANLQLRVKPSSVRWSIRVRLHGEQRRYDLGPAVAGDEDVGRWSPIMPEVLLPPPRCR